MKKITKLTYYSNKYSNYKKIKTKKCMKLKINMKMK